MITSPVNGSSFRSYSINKPPASGQLLNKRTIEKKARSENDIKRSFSLPRISKSLSSLAELERANQSLKRHTRALQVVTGVSIGIAVATIFGGPIGTGLGVALGSAYALIGPQKVIEIFQRGAKISHKYISHGFQFIYNKKMKLHK